MSKLKRGKYSKAEEQFVIDNVYNLTVKEIAEQLGRATDSVETLIKKKKLRVVVTKEEEEEVQRLLGLLYESPHWEKVKTALTKDEIGLFEKDWVSMISHFDEDIWYTEEKYIVDWIILDIRKYRILKMEKQCLEDITQLEIDLEREYNLEEDGDKSQIQLMEMQLAAQKTTLKDFTKNLKDILEKMEKISDKLKANREERRDIKANEDTYWGYIQMLEDEKFRKKESRQAQLMAKAEKVAREKLYEYHEFSDGQVDIPLLTPEIALRKQKEENEQKASDNVRRD